MLTPPGADKAPLFSSGGGGEGEGGKLASRVCPAQPHRELWGCDFFASSHFFASHNENFAASIVVERVWMVAGVLVHSVSWQYVLENNFVIVKWLDVLSRGNYVVVLPLQAGAWVSDSIISVPAHCLSDLLSQVSPPRTYYGTVLYKGLADAAWVEGWALPLLQRQLHANSISLPSEKAAQEAFLPLLRPEEGLLKVSVEVYRVLATVCISCSETPGLCAKG